MCAANPDTAVVLFNGRPLDLSAVDAAAEQICIFGEEAMEMPEAGYKEYKSSDHMRQAVEKLGLSVEEYARIDRYGRSESIDSLYSAHLRRL